jgi:hypothetical protein
MNDARSSHDSIGCGIVQGFHRDDSVALILQRRPSQRDEWLTPGDTPVKGQRVKVQVTTADTWGILTGRITEVGDGFVIAIAHRTTDDETLPSGPYQLTLRYDESMQRPWILTHAELSNSE